MSSLDPYTIDLSKREDYEKGEPVRIVWTSDWHVEAKCCDYDAIRQMLDQEKSKVNTYFAHGGDWFNMVSMLHPHAATAMGGTIFDYTRKEFFAPDWIDLAIERVQELLKGTEGRWLMVHSGNHDRRFEMSGKKLIENLAKDLGANYGGIETFWTLKSNRHKLKLLSGHSYGGGYGEFTGALSNKLSRMLGRFDVDAILLGHYHQPAISDEMEVGQGGKEIHKCGAISPSMLRTYQKGQMNYGMSRFMAYRGIGYVLLKWSPENGFFKPEVITIPKK